MERKIGEIFEYNNELYQAIDNTHGVMCSGCIFVNEYNECEANISVVGNCGCKDGNPLIFKKLKKVGEPYEDNGLTIQRYRIYYDPIIAKSDIIKQYVPGLINIEIKQNKDMEEKKLNLKPFDLDAAKQGKPVCTRDGRKARVICFDAKGDICPIIALIEDNGIDIAFRFDREGKNAYNKSDLDLMMLSEKKEGWINLYNADTTFYYVEGKVHECKDEAIKEAKCEIENGQREKNEYVKTVKVEWEE